MGDAIAREAKRKRPNPNRDRTAVCDLIPVRFQGMTPVSDGDKKDLWRFDSPEVGCTIGAPSAWIFLVRLHACRPDSASPGAGRIAELHDRYKPSGSTWYQSVGILGTEAPAWTRRCNVGKDAPSEIQQNLGVPVENMLTSDFL